MILVLPAKVFLFGGSYTLLGLGDMRLYAMLLCSEPWMIIHIYIYLDMHRVPRHLHSVRFRLAADVVLFSLALCINGIASLLILE